MNFKVIPVYKRKPDDFDKEITYRIPIKVLEIKPNEFSRKKYDLIVERLDFYDGNLVKTKAWCWEKSLEYFPNIPFITDGIVYKEKIREEALFENDEDTFRISSKIKVIGKYNTGLIQKLYGVEDKILDNDEKEIEFLYNDNYNEIRHWLEGCVTDEFDIKPKF